MIKTNLEGSFKYYKETVEKPINNYKLYIKISLGFIQFIMQKVFDGYDVALSSTRSLGVIGVRGTKVKPRIIITEDGKEEVRGLAPDWGATRKMWATNEEAKQEREVLFCLNEHTNGVRYRMIWSIADMNGSANKEQYNLVFSQGLNGNKRKLSRLARQGKEYYTQND